MDKQSRRARIELWEKDGDYIRVTFTREDGQRVCGLYHCFGWAKAPRGVVQDLIEMTALPPICVAGGGGRMPVEAGGAAGSRPALGD